MDGAMSRLQALHSERCVSGLAQSDELGSSAVSGHLLRLALGCFEVLRAPRLVAMKNIQAIDGAVNCVYDVFAATEEEFTRIFQHGCDIAFSEDVWANGEEEELKRVFDGRDQSVFYLKPFDIVRVSAKTFNY